MADFQQFEVQDSEWQTVVPKKHKRRLQIDPIPPEDNEARAVWRQNVEVPDADAESNDDPKRIQRSMYRFSKDFPPIYSMLESRVDLRTAGLFPEIEEIATETNSFIKFLPPAGDRPVAVEIYGTKEQREGAKKRINAWALKESAPERANHVWTKIRSLTVDQKARNEKRLKKAAEEQQYRRNTPHGMSLNAESMGFFEWPKDEVRPEEVFGRSLEALDAIRVAKRVYITYDATTGLFQMLGEKDRVKQAAKMLRATYFQVLARKVNADTTYLVQPLPMVVDDAVIVLTPYISDSTGKGYTGRPEVCPEVIDTEEVTEENEGSHTAAYQRRLEFIQRTMHDILQNTLSALPYYRGHIEMRATLGTFILTRYKQRSQLSFTEFESMMASPQVGAKISKGVSIGQNLNLHRNLFYPFRGGPDSEDHNAKPVFTTTLTISCVGYGKFRLEFVHDHDTSNEKPLSSKFSIIDHSETGSTELMGIYLIDIPTCSAWHIYAKASDIADLRKWPRLAKFVDSIKVKDGILVPGSDALVHIDSLERREVRRYDIAHSLYTCEVAKVEELVNSKKPEDNSLAKYKLKCGYETLSLYLADWGSMFAENAKLEIGQGSAWDPTFGTWFPEWTDRKDNHIDGVTAFLDVLNRVEQAVMGGDARDFDLKSNSESSGSTQL